MLTPQPRVKAMAVVPIHDLKSDFLSKNDVSLKKTILSVKLC